MEKCLLYREENADFKSGLGGLDIGELASDSDNIQVGSFFTCWGEEGISDNLSMLPRTDVLRQIQGQTNISSLPRLINMCSLSTFS